VNQVTRPKSIRIIGWLFVVSAALGLLSALQIFFLAGFMKLYVLPPELSDPKLAKDLGEIYGEVSNVMLLAGRHSHWFALGQVALSVFTLVAGVNFLMLKAWARSLLEIISWSYLVLFIYIARVWRQLSGELPELSSLRRTLGEEYGDLLYYAAKLGRMMPVLIILAGIVVTLLMVAMLRKQEVRTAMRQSKAGRSSHL